MSAELRARRGLCGEATTSEMWQQASRQGSQALRSVTRRAVGPARSARLRSTARAEEPAGEESSLFLGAQSTYTIDPSFYYPKHDSLPALMPCFRLMDDQGVPVPGAVLPDIDKETCVRMMHTMVSVNEFDKVYNDAQRQGRLSFYFTNRGEEAVAVGTAAALKFTDWIWPQYRELGASFWRGITYEDAANQRGSPWRQTGADGVRPGGSDGPGGSCAPPREHGSWAVASLTRRGLHPRDRPLVCVTAGAAATTSTRRTAGSCRCTWARPRSTRCTSSPTLASRRVCCTRLAPAVAALGGPALRGLSPACRTPACAAPRVLDACPGPVEQVPASVGSAFALRKRGEDQCSITYFGEGCVAQRRTAAPPRSAVTPCRDTL